MVAGGDIGQKATIFAPKVSKPQEATPAPSFLAKKMAPAADQASAQQVHYYQICEPCSPFNFRCQVGGALTVNHGR